MKQLKMVMLVSLRYVSFLDDAFRHCCWLRSSATGGSFWRKQPLPLASVSAQHLEILWSALLHSAALLIRRYVTTIYNSSSCCCCYYVVSIWRRSACCSADASHSIHPSSHHPRRRRGHIEISSSLSTRRLSLIFQFARKHESTLACAQLRVSKLPVVTRRHAVSRRSRGSRLLLPPAAPLASRALSPHGPARARYPRSQSLRTCVQNNDAKQKPRYRQRTGEQGKGAATKSVGGTLCSRGGRSLHFHFSSSFNLAVFPR